MLISEDTAARSGHAERDTLDDVRRRKTEAAFARYAATQDPEVRRQALEDVVLANLRVAKGMAASHRDKGVPQEDLEQVAYTALVAAAQRFRPEEGKDFLAFAVPTIRGEIKRYFRDFGWTVRPPRRVQEIHQKVLSTRERLAKELDRAPTPAEIAQELGESEQHVSEALSLNGCFTPSSLDRPLGEDGESTLGELLPETDDGSYEAAEARAILAPLVRRLAPRDRDVLKLRYYEGLTQQEIGEALGVTQTQVSRILSRIQAELREAVAPREEALAG